MAMLLSTIRCINAARKERNGQRVRFPARDEQNAQALRRYRHARVAQGMCALCREKRCNEHTQLCERHWFISIAASFRQHARTTTISTPELAKVLRALMLRQHWRCPYTGALLVPGLNASLDHQYPRSRFPELVADVNHVEWVDQVVNQMKQNLTPTEFFAMCRLIMSYKARRARTFDRQGGLLLGEDA